MASNIFTNTELDLVSTEALRSQLLNLSLTSIYSVEIKDVKSIWDQMTTTEVNILAYEAVLPGTSFELGQVFGDRQGITEAYPTKRVYPPIDVSFYIKSDYKIVTFFEKWMEKMSPLIGGLDESTAYYKFNYPNTYEKNINIVKFEKDARPEGERLNKRFDEGSRNNPRTVTYSLLNAYPTNIIAIPVSYDQSNILKTTITFNYDRYIIQNNKGKQGTSAVTVPQSNSVVTTANSESQIKPEPTSTTVSQDLSKFYGPGLPGEAAEILRKALEQDYVQRVIIDNPAIPLDEINRFVADNIISL